MKQVILRKGRVLSEEVDAPAYGDGQVLIEVEFSCLSPGTELNGVKSGRESLLSRARKHPDKVKQVIELARSQGVARTFTKVKGKIDGGVALGYSLVGIVRALGSGVSSELDVGMRVAAAGVGYASHAGVVAVPENLVARVEDGTPIKSASAVAIGAIAMQGVRRADIKLGEQCVVIGAGFIGNLAAQMLMAAGARVAIVDLNEDRLRLLQEAGAELTVNPQNTDAVTAVNVWSGGRGADAVLFAAATNSSDPLSQAFQMCRKKGRVVLVGVSGMELRREDMYKKELDFLVSTSYGPGRYDANYEERGVDYPYAYVRWTEKRNMSHFLHMLKTGAVNIPGEATQTVSIEDVETGYEGLLGSAANWLTVYVDYGFGWETSSDDVLSAKRSSFRGDSVSCRVPVQGRPVNVAIIGAGSFVTSMHLPNMKEQQADFNLRAVCNRTGYKAKEVANNWGAQYHTTDVARIFADEEIDLVIITTRHDSHADLSIAALEAGKHVFVEKPVATTTDQLLRVGRALEFAQSNGLVYMPGFNRRFADGIQLIKAEMTSRVSPAFISYVVNTNRVDDDSWLHLDGGRIVGEVCHFIDVCRYLVGSAVESINVTKLHANRGPFRPDDNLAITLRYKDGSVAIVTYFVNGSDRVPKEVIKCQFDKKTYDLVNFSNLTVTTGSTETRTLKVRDKGQFAEFEELAKAIRDPKSKWPIGIEEIIETTDISLTAHHWREDLCVG
jgi:predicted dehydrogenase/threonine dehydrogenase-like Zn-dependent dehydrogenase